MKTQTHPTAQLIKNINMEKEFTYSLNKLEIDNSGFFVFKSGRSCSSSHYNSLYGYMIRGKISIYNSVKGDDIEIRNKNGIEILGMKPSVKTSDGKFKYKGISIKDLKAHCKNNGLKKYSSLDKLGMVKLLMTL